MEEYKGGDHMLNKCTAVSEILSPSGLAPFHFMQKFLKEKKTLKELKLTCMPHPLFSSDLTTGL